MTQIKTEELNASPSFSKKGNLKNLGTHPEERLGRICSLFQNPRLEPAEGIAGAAWKCTEQIPGLAPKLTPLKEGSVHFKEYGPFGDCKSHIV